MQYQVPLEISKQGDDLWRVKVPSLPGCFVDEPTLADALYQIHEVIAMFLDIHQEEGRTLPDEIKESITLPIQVTIQVAPDEIAFDRVLPNGDRVPVSTGKTGRQSSVCSLS
jgi:predicted RNase H-like HicB family nuclease